MSKENKQVKKNLIFNFLSLGINICVGVFYTPYLVKTLGVIAYGVIPLALIINQYINVLSGSLTSALTRFYTIALQKKNNDEASKYISTSIVVIICIIIISIVPMFFFVNNIDEIFTIPLDLVNSSKLLFAFTLFSFVLTLISSVFNITLYAYNRLDYLNIVSVIRLSCKFLFVVILFISVNNDIAYVGIANFLTELIILVFSVFAFFKFTNENIKINLRNFDKTSLSVLSVMASWVIVQQLGDTMLYRTDNIIVNKFWSTKESGIIGAFTELGSYVMTLATVVTSLFGPLILQAYGKDEHDKVREMTLDNSLTVGILVSVMVGILCGFSPIILKVWLGNDFVQKSFWLYFKLLLIPFYAAAGVFSFAARAWNKIKFPAITTLILGVINLILVWFIGKYYNTSEIAIPLILFICLVFGIIQSYFLNGFVLSTFYKNIRKTIIFNSLKMTIVLFLISILGYILSPLLLRINVFVSLVCIMIIAIVSLFLSLRFALTKQQSNSIISYLWKKTH